MSIFSFDHCLQCSSPCCQVPRSVWVFERNGPRGFSEPAAAFAHSMAPGLGMMEWTTVHWRAEQHEHAKCVSNCERCKGSRPIAQTVGRNANVFSAFRWERLSPVCGIADQRRPAPFAVASSWLKNAGPSSPSTPVAKSNLRIGHRKNEYYA